MSDDFKGIYYCPSREDKTTLIPESYDFRVAHPNCTYPAISQGNCSAAYAIATSSMISDRFCLYSGKYERVSPQYVLSCDLDVNEGCTKGYAHRVHDFYYKNKLVNETCMPFANGSFVNCTEKCSTFMADSSKLNRICGVEGPEQLKRELVMHGPIVSEIEVHDDFLTYKEGIYTPDYARYVYAGKHVVKVIGWGEEKGVKYWLIENSWGADWGENGFGKILLVGKDDLLISRLGIASVIEGKKEEKKSKKEEGKKEETIPEKQSEKAPEPEKK